MLILLVCTHLYLTFKTGFIQRKVFLGIKLSVKQDSKAEGDIHCFDALATALAATIGTGNIVGVGTAIALGGPGAIFWMWVSGVFGIATKYAESLIAIKYRVKTEKGTMLGGAMYALERGLKMKWLGTLFALFGCLASFGIGSTVQSNAIATVLNRNMHIPFLVSAIVISIFLALVIVGGIKSISRVCTKFVPLMSILYVVGCLIVLLKNINYILPAISEIINSAFQPRAAGGGFIAATFMSAARFGIARGLFSSESGMGSAAIAAVAAKTRNPFRQALVSSTGTFWDTVVICAMTGVVIVSGILANPGLIDIHNVDGSILTSIVFGQVKYIGPIILTFGLILFAFTTTLGWAYYGERCIEYLFGVKANIPYRIIYTATTFLGAVISLNIVWGLADTFNALMAIPNLVAVLLLSNLVAAETKHYLTGDNIDKIDNTPIALYTLKSE
jgi:AGCS family alanine or glycine:cation symporter